MTCDRERVDACLDEIARLQDALRVANATLVPRASTLTTRSGAALFLHE